MSDICKWGRLKKSIKKKKSFFTFLSWSTPRQVAVIRKAIQQLPASLSSREKSSFRSVILTGFFYYKYSLFWGGYQIYQSGDLKKSIKKKNFFYFFSWSVSEPSARIRMPIRPTGKRMTTFLSEWPANYHLSKVWNVNHL